MKKLVALLAVSAAALMLVSAASAAKHTFTVSPNPGAVVGSPLVFSGCGYTPGTLLVVQAINNTKTAEYILQQDVTVDGSGCFTNASEPYAAPAAGKWTANLFVGSAPGGKLAAPTLVFTVG